HPARYIPAVVGELLEQADATRRHAGKGGTARLRPAETIHRPENRASWSIRGPITTNSHDSQAGGRRARPGAWWSDERTSRRTFSRCGVPRAGDAAHHPHRHHLARDRRAGARDRSRPAARERLAPARPAAVGRARVL